LSPREQEQSYRWVDGGLVLPSKPFDVAGVLGRPRPVLPHTRATQVGARLPDDVQVFLHMRTLVGAVVDRTQRRARNRQVPRWGLDRPPAAAAAAYCDKCCASVAACGSGGGGGSTRVAGRVPVWRPIRDGRTRCGLYDPVRGLPPFAGDTHVACGRQWVPGRRRPPQPTSFVPLWPGRSCRRSVHLELSPWMGFHSWPP
jgi:hypothetical protein